MELYHKSVENDKISKVRYDQKMKAQRPYFHIANRILAKRLLPFGLAVVLALPLLARAAVYGYFEPDGSIHFTDRPIEGRKADKVIRSLNTASALQRSSRISVNALRERQSGSTQDQDGEIILPPLAGRLPIKGRITSPPGKRLDPFTGKESWHNGVDIAAPIGTPIKTIAPGTVAFSESRGGFGNLIVIDHGNGVTLYAHLDRSTVLDGDTIGPDQIIGFTGNSGRSTGPHLHFEAWEKGQNITQRFINATPLADRTASIAKPSQEPVRMERQDDGSILLTNQKGNRSRTIRRQRLPDGSILLSF